MSRSPCTNELVFDPELKVRTTRANRKKKRQEDNQLTLTISTSNFESKREAELSENMAEYRIFYSIK
jgi:hypothetical protein